MKRLIFILLLAMALSSCSEKYVDSFPTTELCYENNSSHTIEIVRTDFSTDSTVRDLPETISLKPQERYSTKVISRYLCRVFSKAIFDWEVAADYQTYPDYSFNITKADNYQNKSEDGLLFSYTYTFTDEDYQYALEYGTKLELGE